MCLIISNCRQILLYQHIQNIFRTSFRTLQLKHGRLNFRYLNKLNSKLNKFYNVPANISQNISQINSTITIKQLLYKKYIEKSLENDVWDEVIDAVVSNNLELQIELCSRLLHYDDQSAVKYALKYQIPLNYLKKTLKNKIEELDNKKYPALQLALPHSAIIYVDENNKFNAMLEVLRNAEIIGCDSEWKAEKYSRLSIIQIATWNWIFIIDLKAILTDYDGSDEWSKFYEIFTNRQIKKLGFGFGADLQMMSVNLPEFERLSLEIENLLDFQTISQKLEFYHPEVFPRRWPGSGRGLADVTKMFLGKSLDKVEKISNWDQRPLSHNQMLYAALDAFCLLQIYAELNERAVNYGVNLDLLMRSSQIKRKTLKPPIRSADKFKVLLDCTLHELGKQLLLSGVDVKTVELSNDENMSCAMLAACEEGRIVVSSRRLSKKNSRQHNPKEWFCIDLLLPTRIQLKRLFKFYNIQDMSSDIFQQCQACTCSKYLPMPGEVVRLLWKCYLDRLTNDENVHYLQVEMFYVCANCGKMRI